MEIGNSSFSRSGNIESEWSKRKEEKNSNGIEKSKIFYISVDIFDKLDTPNSIELKRRALGFFFQIMHLKHVIDMRLSATRWKKYDLISTTSSTLATTVCWAYFANWITLRARCMDWRRKTKKKKKNEFLNDGVNWVCERWQEGELRFKLGNKLKSPSCGWHARDFSSCCSSTAFTLD